MAHCSEANPTDLCRVCIQDVTCVPSENIFESTSPDCLSIHRKLSSICSQVFAAEPDQKPLASEAIALPPNVCIDCKSKIDAAYELQQMCLESNRKLLEMLKTPLDVKIKEEPEDIQTEPSELQLPVVFAESLAEPSEKSPRKAAKFKIKKGKVDNKEVLQCEKCNYTTIRASTVMKHMKLKHPNEVHRCDQCNEAYFDKDKLEEHKKVHTIAKPYPCPNCNKFFKKQRTVLIHLKSCSGETPFLCTECGKAFVYSSSLRLHVLRHKEKSFICDTCPFKSHTKGALKIHMLTHTKERKFPCDICGHRALTKFTLKQHMMSHTDERPHPCDLCNMRFRSSDNLRRHKRSHTGEKPYKCTHCDRAFSQTNDLVKHSKTHFGDNPYKCDRCDAAFRLLTDLRNHYKEHYQTGESQESDLPDAVDFTSYSLLKRRSEQEKRDDPHRNANQSSGGPNGVELNLL